MEHCIYEDENHLITGMFLDGQYFIIINPSMYVKVGPLIFPLTSQSKDMYEIDSRIIMLKNNIKCFDTTSARHISLEHAVKIAWVISTQIE